MLTLTLVLAQLIPVTRVNSTCPLGYYVQGSYCIPSRSIRPSNQSINISGNSCPLGTYTTNSGYCTRSSIR